MTALEMFVAQNRTAYNGLYVKPEEGAAYYVINKFSGKLEL